LTRRLDGLAGIVRYLDFEGPAHASDLSQVTAGLGGIDVDGADDLESLAIGDLADDARADRPEPDVDDPDGSRRGWHQ
jgi:hypothetical protein